MSNAEQFVTTTMAMMGPMHDRAGRSVPHREQRARLVARWTYRVFVEKFDSTANPWAGDSPAPSGGVTDPARYARVQFGGGRYSGRFVEAIRQALGAVRD